MTIGTSWSPHVQLILHFGDVNEHIGSDIVADFEINMGACMKMRH